MPYLTQTRMRANCDFGISGVGRYLKERNPPVRVIGADPEGSVLSGDAPRPWKVEGIGEDFVPKTLNGQVVDEWIRVGDAESFDTARALARREGILAGGSSGTTVAAALRYARRLGPDDFVVALCADTGRNYLSKIYDDAWLAENGLLQVEAPARTVLDLLTARGQRDLVTVSPDATAAEAVELMQARGISQLPVLRDGHSVGGTLPIATRADNVVRRRQLCMLGRFGRRRGVRRGRRELSDLKQFLFRRIACRFFNCGVEPARFGLVFGCALRAGKSDRRDGFRRRACKRSPQPAAPTPAPRSP